VLRSNLRDSEVVCRPGGDEFVALMWNTDLHMARRTLPRLRQALAEEKAYDQYGVHIEFSAGIVPVSVNRLSDIETLLEEAYHQMYRDKWARTRVGLESHGTPGSSAARRVRRQ
jgi:diguanylate cyclase (GGDEF)-like protein